MGLRHGACGFGIRFAAGRPQFGTGPHAPLGLSFQVRGNRCAISQIQTLGREHAGVKGGFHGRGFVIQRKLHAPPPLSVLLQPVQIEPPFDAAEKRKDGRK
jgi:hypothetical protein